MLSKRVMISTCAAALLMATSATTLRAQPLDSRTEFTFNQPVELPNVTLPPGTYVFRFVDATTGKKVMQVQAKDSSNKTYGMFLTISAQRPRPSDEAELRFMETPAGQPAAIKTWWYPGNTIGREFIYPKSQARRLAQATNEQVLTTHAESVANDQMDSADLAYVAPNGQETPVSDDQLVDAASSTAPVGTAGQSASQSSTPAPGMASTPAREGTMARTSLPSTSTSFAGIGLIGLMSLLSATAIRLRA